MKWSKDELRKIASTDDLDVSPWKTYGTPTWIWSVVVGDALYARAYNGRQSRWYAAALLQMAGRITASGMTKDVVLLNGNAYSCRSVVANRDNRSAFFQSLTRSSAQSVLDAGFEGQQEQIFPKIRILGYFRPPKLEKDQG